MPKTLSFPISLRLLVPRIRATLDALRNTATKAGQESPELSEEEGFRAFQLVESNFPQWRPKTFESGDALAEQIQLFMQTGVRDTELRSTGAGAIIEIRLPVDHAV